jgi:DNA-directed RNA polymerase specialized sigma24 family protein
VYSLLSNIGFRNFALIYDQHGRPNRAVVLGAQVDESAPIVADASHAAEPVAQPLNPGERDTLQKELDRWTELKQEQRGRIEDRLKSLPPSEEREQLVKEYGRKLLGIKK